MREASEYENLIEERHITVHNYSCRLRDGRLHHETLKYHEALLALQQLQRM